LSREGNYIGAIFTDFYVGYCYTSNGSKINIKNEASFIPVPHLFPKGFRRFLVGVFGVFSDALQGIYPGVFVGARKRHFRQHPKPLRFAAINATDFQIFKIPTGGGILPGGKMRPAFAPAAPPRPAGAGFRRSVAILAFFPPHCPAKRPIMQLRPEKSI